MVIDYCVKLPGTNSKVIELRLQTPKLDRRGKLDYLLMVLVFPLLRTLITFISPVAGPVPRKVAICEEGKAKAQTGIEQSNMLAFFCFHHPISDN